MFHKLTMPINACKQTNVRLLALQVQLKTSLLLRPQLSSLTADILCSVGKTGQASFAPAQ